MAAAAILDNFEWPYLRNGYLYSVHRAVIFAIAQLSCVLKDNQRPRPRSKSLLIGRNMDNSSVVVWKYVRPVDSVRAAVAH